MLNICVCGWYLREFDEFYMMLHKLHHKEGVNVHVVSNKHDSFLKTMDLPFTVRDNKGLEFGAYDYYLKFIWNEKSNVIFMHDDIKVQPFMRDFEILPPERLFDHFKDLDIDHAYVFNSRKEDVENDGKHGRMMYCSSELLKWLLSKGGLWWDDKNNGKTHNGNYNFGIENSDSRISKSSLNVKSKLYIQALQLMRRGQEVKQ